MSSHFDSVGADVSQKGVSGVCFRISAVNECAARLS